MNIFDGENVAETLAEEYYEIIEADKKYTNAYEVEKNYNNEMLNNIQKYINEYYKWREIENKQELQEILANKKRKDVMELLRIEDYYNDELGELIEKHFDITFSECSDEEIENILSVENYTKLLEDKTTPIQIKECVRIVLKCKDTCEKIFEYIQR